MEHFSILDRLPEGIEFPPHLSNRIWHVPQSRRLIFSGFMTKATYDELIALSRDSEYRRALEQLFVHSSDEISPRGSHNALVGFLALLVAASLALLLTVKWLGFQGFSRGEGSANDVPMVSPARAGNGSE